MAIRGVCRWLLVVFGSTRPQKKIKKNFRRVWAGFSVGDIRPGFRNLFIFQILETLPLVALAFFAVVVCVLSQSGG